MNELHNAVRWHKLEKVRELLEGGVDPNTPNRHGGRPLHYVAALGYATIAEVLFKHGARSDLPDNMGIPPFQLITCAIEENISSDNPCSDYPATMAVFRKHMTWQERCSESSRDCDILMP